MKTSEIEEILTECAEACIGAKTQQANTTINQEVSYFLDSIKSDKKYIKYRSFYHNEKNRLELER